MAISFSITCDGCGATETASTTQGADEAVSPGLLEESWTHGGGDTYCDSCAMSMKTFDTMIGVTDSKSYARRWLGLLGRTIPFGDPCAEPHPFVELGEFEVDTLIAPLVSLCWRLGIATLNSCQGDPDLHELWTRYAPNNQNAAQDHQAYLTLDSLDDAILLASAIESFIENGKSWKTSISITSPGTAAATSYFLLFPGEVLEKASFMSYMSASLISHRKAIPHGNDRFHQL